MKVRVVGTFIILRGIKCERKTGRRRYIYLKIQKKSIIEKKKDWLSVILVGRSGDSERNEVDNVLGGAISRRPCGLSKLALSMKDLDTDGCLWRLGIRHGPRGPVAPPHRPGRRLQPWGPPRPTPRLRCFVFSPSVQRCRLSLSLVPPPWPPPSSSNFLRLPILLYCPPSSPSAVQQWRSWLRPTSTRRRAGRTRRCSCGRRFSTGFPSCFRSSSRSSGGRLPGRGSSPASAFATPPPSGPLLLPRPRVSSLSRQSSPRRLPRRRKFPCPRPPRRHKNSWYGELPSSPPPPLSLVPPIKYGSALHTTPMNSIFRAPQPSFPSENHASVPHRFPRTEFERIRSSYQEGGRVQCAGHDRFPMSFSISGSHPMITPSLNQRFISPVIFLSSS